MIITDYYADNFRNLYDVNFIPDKGTNVISGDNGQGKTSIIESIWLFTGCHSFRTHKYGEMVKTGCKESRVKLDFDAHDLSNSASLNLSTKREFTFNGIRMEGPRRFLGEFQAVVFSPFSLSLIQDAPSERRKFLDIAVSMVKPAYASHLIKYSKILANRNALLKQIAMGEADEDFLAPWDEELAKTGARVTAYRLSYVDNLSVIASEIYRELSGGREELRVEYVQSSRSEAIDEYELTENIFMALQKNRSSDLRRILTSAGPHKDELSVTIDGMQARNYGSQGQQRTCALALKLGEAYIIKQITGEYPVVLLDDVMSELDTKRRRFLVEYLKDWQVFITCCDDGEIDGLESYKKFRVSGGRITE